MLTVGARCVRRASVLAAASLLLAGCAASPTSTGSTETLFPPALLSTTIPLPEPVPDQTDPVQVAQAFLLAYAGGDLQRACQLSRGELQAELGECRLDQKLDRLPELTLQDSCPLGNPTDLEYAVRFHVMPGSGQYPLPVADYPQDLRVTVRAETLALGFYVEQQPVAYDSSTGCGATG